MPKQPPKAPSRGGIVLFLLTLALPAAAADPEFPSSWRTVEVVVDGKASEWAGKLVPLPEAAVSVGIQNDGSFLYLCLRTSDEAQKKRIRAAGVTFWMDASGKADHAFGVRYPAPPDPPAGRTEGARPRGDAPPHDGERSGSEPPPEGRMVRFERQAASDSLQVLGRDAAGGGRMKVAAVRPMAAAMAEEDGFLVVELKVPLASGADTPFGVATGAGRTIAVGVEGSQSDRELRSGGGRGGHGGGGDGVSIGRDGVNASAGGVNVGAGPGGVRVGTGGGGGGRSGGGRPGGDRSGPPQESSGGKPLKGSFRVQLASPPAPQPSPAG